MAVNKAISTQGFKLEVDTSDAPHTTPALVEIIQLTDIPDMSQEASDLDASHLQSTAKEYIAGLKDSQSVVIPGQRVATDPGQNFLRDNAGAISAIPFVATFADGAVLSILATIKKFGVSGGVDAVEMFSASIRPSGDQTWSGTGAPVTT